MTTGRLGILAIGAIFGLLAVAERRRPLRRRTVRGALVRASRNAALGGLGLLASTLVEWLVVREVGRWADRHQVGVLRRVPLPPPAKAIAGFLALDYSLWAWHAINHRVPFLWRFHLVHHVDRDLDASTGFRFHFGELALTGLLRIVQVLVIGAGPRTLQTWQGVLTASVLFHHSNLRLPIAVERRLCRLVATPRLHGIHHSEIQAETDSNYASLLTIWDVLHGTFLPEVPQEVVTIGVPAWRDERELRFLPVLAMPFGPQREDFEATRTLPPRREGRGALAE